MGISIAFDSAGHKLQGRFHPATGTPPFPTVLLLHGFPGNEEDVLGLGQRLSPYGINTLTFNYRGTYQSEGAYSLRHTLEDIEAALAYLQRGDVVDQFDVDRDNLIVGGYSYGGGMALTYAANHPQITRIISVAGTDHGEFAREYLHNPNFAEMIDATFAELVFPGGPVHFDRQETLASLTQDPEPYDLRQSAPALAGRDILLIGGWDDPNVTVEGHVLPLYRALVAVRASRVRIIALQDDHEFGKSRGALADIMAQWILAA